MHHEWGQRGIGGKVRRKETTRKTKTQVGGQYYKWILREIEWNGMDWINLVQDRDHWRAFVNTIMNLRVP
jgi:hypothetical protein